MATPQSTIPSPPPSPSSSRPTHIVGIGASAGGLEALERFFENMPAETGMAFVVVQHLSPDFKSLTDELLARRTRIPIQQVEDGVEVTSNAIYLLPPRKDMIISEGRLLLTDKDPSLILTLPIDGFFRSLAQDARERAVGIILSGTGSDGSRGIRDIHDAGGLVVVQNPATAKFDGMPRSAVNTGVVDFVLSPEEMTPALLHYIQHPLGSKPAPPAEIVPPRGMGAIHHLLREAYDIDFSHYKPDTVARRVERRLAINRGIGLEDYVAQLASDSNELNALYKDLLIGVTRFFRDREAFERLQTDVLPMLLRPLGKDDEFRAWVAGCATGEEAYSLAILVQDCLDALQKSVTVKIFATDVHRASLDIAGAGIYSDASLVDVSPARLGRYFQRRGDSYQVVPELRKMVVFAQHNLLKDAPFTKLDLISCRNLLIYFQPPAQKKVLSLFHFGLKTGGTLFLGPSESPGDLGEEFETFDQRWKLFRKRRDVRLAPDIRLTSTLGPAPSLRPSTAVSPSFDAQLMGAYDALLNEFMPPSLLVNDRREVVHSFSGANAYLRPKEGRFSTDVLDMVDPDLRMALTGAMQRAFKELKPVSYKGLRLTMPEGERTLNITVKPVRNPRSDLPHVLICFERSDFEAPSETPQEIDRGQASREHLSSLESELRYTKENLQATIEEMETSNEELQATNEELVSSNEELQSTNEELHSVNEELYTVNGEYQKKIVELTELTADIENLLNNTQVHTIFLDHNLRIRKFTLNMADTFNLVPHDIGRRIGSFTHRIDHPTLMADIEETLRTGQTIEREVRDLHGHWFLLRVLPYIAGSGVEGVVLTLIDIGVLKRMQAEKRSQDAQLASLLRNSPNLIAIKDLEGRYVLADESHRRLFGRDPVGLTVYDVFPRDVADVLTAQHQRVIREECTDEAEITIPQADGPHTYLSIEFPCRDEDGKLRGVSSIKADVTALKAAEARAREAVQQRDRFLAMLSHELRNPLAAILSAAAALERQGHSQDGTEWVQIIERRARHMARLLDDLLDISRVTRNRIEIRKKVFDLATTVSEVMEETRPWFDERSLKLSVTVPREPLPVEGDPDRLQQIQVNLLRNAAKFTEPGGSVWYCLEQDGAEAVIRVRDTGAGIAPEMLEKVFDLFVQGEGSTHTASGGIGVGLTLVKNVVELHGGQVRVFSEGLGRGSEFVVRLPLSTKPLPQPVPPATQSRGKRNLRILVVEDEPDIRSTMGLLLELEGYSVRTASGATEALTVLREGPVDVAFIDIGLPEVDGYELAQRIRAEFESTPLFLAALTGYGRPSDREKAFDAGFDAHLTKPLKPTDLVSLLEEIAAERQLSSTSRPAAIARRKKIGSQGLPSTAPS